MKFMKFGEVDRVVNRRKYKKPVQFSGTAEEHLRQIAHILGFSDSRIYAIGLDQILSNGARNGRISAEAILKIITEKRDQVAALEEEILQLEQALLGRTVQEKRKAETEKKVISALQQILGANGTYARRLPESDPDDNFWPWWQEQASAVSQLAGVTVTVEDCQKYVRRCSG